MGCAASSPANEDPVQDDTALQAASTSSNIDRQLAQEKENEKWAFLPACALLFADCDHFQTRREDDHAWVGPETGAKLAMS